MNKKILVLFLILPPFILILWALFLVYAQKTGQEVTVSVYGYDPRDLLSGRYISYQIDWKNTDCAQFENKKCPETSFCKEARFGQMCRFYVPEKDAFVLDALFSNRDKDAPKLEVVYVVKEGFTPMAKELLIDGMPWREFLRQNKQFSEHK